MLEASRQATVLHSGSRDVRATTVLPAKAAPNLALAVLLTTNELSRRAAGDSPQAPASTKLPETIAGRLKLEVLAEFNRTPLEQVIKYIGDEIQVDFVVDGEALRLTGYTRNMQQTLSLGKVPAIRVLKELVSAPGQADLAVFIDEEGRKAVLSTKPYLQQQGREPYPLD
jgi:hypothetical protein